MAKYRFFLSTVFASLLLLASATHVNAAEAVSGLWYTEGKEGGVELYPCGEKQDEQVCGRFYWLKTDNESEIPRDKENPDPSKRSRALCRMEFMGGFTPNGQGEYTDGWIYSPQHGQVFNAEMKLIDRNTLSLHGYVMIPLLGESQTWKRAEVMPTCKSGQMAATTK